MLINRLMDNLEMWHPVILKMMHSKAKKCSDTTMSVLAKAVAFSAYFAM